VDTFPKLLVVKGLAKTFVNGHAPKTVFSGIDFDLADRDSLAVVGPSGCGKTTLLLIIAGLLYADAGEVLLHGGRIVRPSIETALVLQHYGLFPWKTVAANIILGAHIQGINISDTELMNVKKDLGIESLDSLYPAQLSGGQRQRVALARAILLRPSLLLLDEPFAAIDAITRERLQASLLALFRRRGFSMITVTHNIEEAVFLGRRIIVLDNKKKGLKTMIDNPLSGSRDFRNNPEFFERCLELRKILEGAG
jgi:NitT/TauT family transport system ATP-binding protein